MTKKCSNHPDDLIHWGFDQWQQLFQTDPVMYEKYREKLLSNLIAQAPEHQRERLKGLMFTMDGEKRRSRSIQAEQARYYGLMIDSLSELNQQISMIFKADEPKIKAKNTEAKILDFKIQK